MSPSRASNPADEHIAKMIGMPQVKHVTKPENESEKIVRSPCQFVLAYEHLCLVCVFVGRMGAWGGV